VLWLHILPKAKWDSKFSEASQILSKFYARAQSFGYFSAARKVTEYL